MYRRLLEVKKKLTLLEKERKKKEREQKEEKAQEAPKKRGRRSKAEICNPEWCKFLISKKRNEPYKHKPTLDPNVQSHLLTVFESLSDNDLLKRCLGCNTQNCNESYSSLIWHIAPKNKFCGKDVVDIASWIAACTFNEGAKIYLTVMDLMGIKIGELATSWSENVDETRIA